VYADALDEALGLRSKVRSLRKRAFTKAKKPRPVTRHKKKNAKAWKLPKPPKPFLAAAVLASAIGLGNSPSTTVPPVPAE